MRFLKLVRNKVPSRIQGKGEAVECVQLSCPKLYKGFLLEKLLEETQEFVQSGEAHELADLLEVISEIQKFSDYNSEKIIRLRKEKRKSHGGFSRKVILLES